MDGHGTRAEMHDSKVLVDQGCRRRLHEGICTSSGERQAEDDSGPRLQGNNELGAEGAGHLGGALEKLTGLQHLDLVFMWSGCCMGYWSGGWHGVGEGMSRMEQFMYGVDVV